EYTLEGTSIEEGSLHVVALYPNPAASLLQVRWSNSGEQVHWKVQDLTGSLLMSGQVSGAAMLELDLNDLPQGTYFLTLQQSSNTITRSFIRQ
ncbi:MAG TPA: hypothetical protein DHW15_05965, partial [Bacteroidetes bacterium]|nr:hypothetical protein [Bacteroidota bacterium]